jgi:hypothetical protein
LPNVTARIQPPHLWVRRRALLRRALALAACLLPGPALPHRTSHPIRFGLTPQEAGNVIPFEAPIAPVDEHRALGALRALRVPGRDLVLRLNRMFWSDGDAGIARYARLVDYYGRRGFQTELQVRYHPPEGHAGDMSGWVAYVRKATRTFAKRRSVVELSITNEVNLPLSANTSDGAYTGAVDAIVRGILAARAEADRMHRRDLKLGFTFAYRYLPSADDDFWLQLGGKATPAFRKALDHVGIQLYPGVFIPPVTTNPASDVIDAVNLLRSCWMPEAGLGRSTAIWVTENGYPTRLGLGQPEQVSALSSTLDAVHAQSGTYNVTDYRYFNLRDNRSTGLDLFDNVGLLFDDYRPKAALGTLHDAIARYGTRRVKKGGKAPRAAARTSRRGGPSPR